MISLFAAVIKRLDWFEFGVASINYTGAFIASLSVAVWVLCAIPRRWSFWVSLCLSAVFAYLMSLTYSRGALLAWICGLGIFFMFSGVLDSRLRKGVIIACLLGFAALTISSGFAARFETFTSNEKFSSDARTDLYIAGFQMLSDAPNGWNDGPQKIYSQWYQKSGDSSTYLSLINSHLQFMAERGISFRLFYIFGWVFAFVIAFPKRKDVFNAAASGVFVCIFVGAFFSNILNYWVLWILPILFLMAACLVNFHKFKKLSFWIVCFAVSISIYVLIHIASYLYPRDVRILKHGDEILIGSFQPKVLIVSDESSALGSAYGRELKEFLKDKDFSVLIAAKQSGRKYKTVLIASDFDLSELSKVGAQEICILNAMPSDSQNIDELSALDPSAKVKVILGNMSDWRRKIFWKNISEKKPDIELIILSGVADYIPDWPKLLDGTFEVINTDEEESE